MPALIENDEPTAPLRRLRHPGPAQSLRVQVAPCRVTPLRLWLDPGVPLATAVATAFAEAGFAAGWVRLRDATVAGLDYLLPVPADDPGSAPGHGAPHHVAQGGRIVDAGLHLGLCDGAPKLHGHGILQDVGSAPRVGHLLADSGALADRVEVAALGLSGATLQQAADPETGRDLFAPRTARPVVAGDFGGRALLLGLRPNIDLCATIDRVCARHGILDARIHGLGSLIGAEFDDAPDLAAPGTEVLLTDGVLRGGESRLHAAVSDSDGGFSAGRLTRDRNPVCIGFDILVEEILGRARRPRAAATKGPTE